MWRKIEPLKDGVPVVFVGVHAVAWERDWGAPRVGFVEDDGWIPYPENKPDKDDTYIVTVMDTNTKDTWLDKFAYSENRGGWILSRDAKEYQIEFNAIVKVTAYLDIEPYKKRQKTP